MQAHRTKDSILAGLAYLVLYGQLSSLNDMCIGFSLASYPRLFSEVANSTEKFNPQ